MAFNAYQFKTFIVKPALAAIGGLSDDAVTLMMGTCAQESAFGTYIVQRGMDYQGGIGIYQMQSNTYDYTWNIKVDSSSAMRAKIRLFTGYDGKPNVQRLASDLQFATIMCRLYYATFPEELPKWSDIPGMAAYWKKYWNTVDGAGAVDEFIANYKKYTIC